MNKGSRCSCENRNLSHFQSSQFADFSPFRNVKVFCLFLLNKRFAQEREEKLKFSRANLWDPFISYVRVFLSAHWVEIRSDAFITY